MACFDKKIAIFYNEITNGQKSAIFVLPFFCRENFDFGVLGRWGWRYRCESSERCVAPAPRTGLRAPTQNQRAGGTLLNEWGGYHRLTKISRNFSLV